ncbi:TrpB-like pyridoxal phosphate-dependent enzyme [Acidaminobacterium chupaoyuni]
MSTEKIPYRVVLPESQLPRHWLNLRALMPGGPEPLLNPATGSPITREELCAVFSEGCADQELNTTQTHIPIPEEVFDAYRSYRPSPLCRAYGLEKALDTPARIYYKFEGGNTSGSHKLNSAVAQAYYAKKQGLRGLATETGAGQWGTALSMACAHFGLELSVFMVKTSAAQKPMRPQLMKLFGGKVFESPGSATETGRAMLGADPQCGGSLGTAISEAIETVRSQSGIRYALGSVLDQVLLHQSILGLEARTAMDQLGERPDLVIGCAGGGSNLGGLLAGYLPDRFENRPAPRFLAVEPEACPSLTRGEYRYDFCDAAKLTPMAKMYTLGCDFMPPKIHAGGLRYHGMSPLLSKLYAQGFLDEACAVSSQEVFESGRLFARAEGILPAPESSHAIAAAIRQAMKCRISGESSVILFNLTGTGYCDLAAYGL